jgi:hypothetical protein
MSRPDVLEELGGCADSDGRVSRMFNCGIVMKYTYDGWAGEPLPQVASDDGDIDAILTNYVSAWQAAHWDRSPSTWFSLGDAFECLYGQAHLYKAYNLRQRRVEIEETAGDERTESEVSELADIPAQIAEHEEHAANYLANYAPSSAE